MLDQALADCGAAVAEFAERVRECEDIWNTPRSNGKWSPAQVTEHVTMALEEGAKSVLEQPSRLPSVPLGLRTVVRTIFFRPTLRKGRMPVARANRGMSPIQGPGSPEVGADRLHLAWQRFEEACRRSSAQGPTFRSTAFGRIGIAEYARFHALHTRHHQAQLRVDAGG
jgi:hypothetical protein